MAEIITVGSKEEAQKMRIELARGQLPININGISKWSRFVSFLPKEHPTEWIASAQPFVTKRLTEVEKKRRNKEAEENKKRREQQKEERNKQKKKEYEERIKTAELKNKERIKKLQQKIEQIKEKNL